MPEAKINDIGVAVIGGAMRTYLLDKDELPTESLLAMMPISIRPTMTQKAAASMPTGSADSVGGDRREPVRPGADHVGDRRGRSLRAAPSDRDIDVARQGVRRVSGPIVDGDDGGSVGRLVGNGPAHGRAGAEPHAVGRWPCTRS